jgi:prophage regulatory protein
VAIRFLSWAEVRDRTSLSRQQIYRRMHAGDFPLPVPLGAMRVGFAEHEVDQWCEGRMAARERGEDAARRTERARSARAAGLRHQDEVTRS